MTDDELRHILSSATGSPRLTARDDLLDALMARIDGGGEDVADAPLPRPMLEAVPARASAARIARRAAGIGVAGWVAIAVGTAAAAAAGALLVLQPSPDAPPQLPPSAPVTTTPDTSELSTPTGPGVTLPSPSPLAPADMELPQIDVTNPELPVLDGVDPGDAVVDAIAPVVSAIDTSRLTSGVLDLVECSGSARVMATATDSHGVTSATLRIATSSGGGASFAMSASGGGQWEADVGPVTAAALGSLLGNARVTVEARDAAGNVGVRQTTVPLSALVCLG